MRCCIAAGKTVQAALKSSSLIWPHRPFYAWFNARTLVTLWLVCTNSLLPLPRGTRYLTTCTSVWIHTANMRLLSDSYPLSPSSGQWVRCSFRYWREQLVSLLSLFSFVSPNIVLTSVNPTERRIKKTSEFWFNVFVIINSFWLSSCCPISHWTNRWFSWTLTLVWSGLSNIFSVRQY